MLTQLQINDDYEFQLTWENSMPENQMVALYCMGGTKK